MLTICFDAAHRWRFTTKQDSVCWWASDDDDDDDDETLNASNKLLVFKDSSGLWGLTNCSSVNKINIILDLLIKRKYFTLIYWKSWFYMIK